MKPFDLPDPRRRFRGVSLLELMLVVALVGIFMSLAVPGYQRYAERGRVSVAVRDIGEMSMTIERYRTRIGRLPDLFSDANLQGRFDPWGRGYAYFNFATFSGMGPDPSRRDGNLRPINTDYDLYSVGKDGQTDRQLNQPASADDVVRGLDGSFIGLGKDF